MKNPILLALLAGFACACWSPAAHARQEGDAAPVKTADTAPAAHDEALAAELRPVLDAMAAAALAADAKAYLPHISKADPEYMAEQVYFANDFAKKPPAELAFELAEVRPGDGGDAFAKLTMRWRMPAIDPLRDPEAAKAAAAAGGKPEMKPERNVSYPVRFVREDNTWKYAGEVWKEHRAPGVIVMYDDGLDVLAERAVEAFNAVRAHVEEGFEHTGTPFASHTQKIKIYGRMRHLQASICLSYEDGLGGWNEPGEAMKLLANRRSTVESLKILLAHEYGHCCTFIFGPETNSMPWWVLEGVAELASEKYAGREKTLRQVERWAKRGEIAPWDGMANFDTFDKRWYGHVYAQGHHFVIFVSDKYRRSGRNKWLRAMANGKTLDEATREVFGLSFEELDQQWRATLPKVEAPEPEPAGAAAE